MMFLFLSYPIVINSECLYRNVPSICGIGLSFHHASIKGLNAQNKCLNWTTLSSPDMSTVWNDTAVPGMACCTDAIQPVSLLYEATQLSYTRGYGLLLPPPCLLVRDGEAPCLLHASGGPSRLLLTHNCGGRRIWKSSTAEARHPVVNVAFKGEHFQSILNGILVCEDQAASKVFILRSGTNARDVTVVRRHPHARKIYLRLVWSGAEFSRAGAANVAHVDFLVLRRLRNVIPADRILLYSGYLCTNLNDRDGPSKSITLLRLVIIGKLLPRNATPLDSSQMSAF
ncbi:uncharacterized protein G2W53_027482 [Senna tora]|uniref:Uncharacterized protein n=1 Tax=Senna tora TaxID=362788 RepID=A0A834TGY4_9FABA|nr:uncharacterized protein G2W53_027482 [Senna tora]